jgi:argininosuccinate lyase
MTLWGGRFDEAPDDVLWQFTADPVDRRLLEVDVVGSLAHVKMLGAVGLLTSDESSRLVGGLESILGEAQAGSFEFVPTDEDVHTAVERRLGDLVGDVAGKLHTGRSRNDQVCLDLRLYLSRNGRRRIDQLRALITVLVDQAEAVGDTVVASYTHQQQAQAVPLAHHLLAYAWMLVRDIDRLTDALRRVDVSPLGAGASGGSALPLDPVAVADELGMPATFDNSMDAVAARDFVAEYVFAVTQAMVHCSRLAEEAVLWASAEYGWATFADRHTTGSSALPQKKNPDIAELVRGRTAAVIGDLSAVVALQKGLPLTYNRDLQEDKRLVFHADDTLGGALDALSAMLQDATFDPPHPDGFVTALDLAEAFVLRGVPFRDAHAAVGRLVASMIEQGRTLSDLSAEELEASDTPAIADDVAVLDPATSIARRATPGGGSMESVHNQLVKLKRRLAADPSTKYQVPSTDDA